MTGTVLWVDEQRVVPALHEALASAGFRTVFTSSDETLETAAAERPSAIVLPLSADDSGVFDLCRRLKSDARTSRTPLLGLSTAVSHGAGTAALDAGADALLSHDAPAAMVAAQIHALLRRRDGVQPSDTMLDRRRQDPALRDTGEKYRRLFDHMAEGFFVAEIVCDAAGTPVDYRYIDANPAFETLTGLKRDAIIGRTARDVLSDIDQAWIATCGRVALTGEPAAVERFFAPLQRYYSGVAYSPRPRQFACAFADVTERRQTDEALREANRKLQTTLDSITDGLFVVDHTWRYTYFNQTGVRLTGIPREHLIGGCVWDLFPHAAGTLFSEGFHRAVETGQPVHFEEFYPEPLNKWLECHCYPSADGLTVYFHDVSQRKRAELNADFLNRQDPVLMREREPIALVAQTLAAIAGHLAVDRVTLCDLTPDGTTCTVHQEHGDGPSMLGVHKLADFLNDEGRDALLAGRELVVADVAADPRTRASAPQYRSFGTAALMQVPLVNGAGLRSALVVDVRRPRAWTREEVQLLRDVAARLFPAVERARAEEALRESTTLLRAVSDASNDAIFAKDLEGRLRFANPATLALVGKSLDQVLGRTDADFLDDKDAAHRVMANDRRVMESGVATELEEIVPLPDGTERIWLSHKSPYRDTGGHVIGLLGISRDITARKRAEGALRRSEQSYREIAEALDVERQKLAATIRALPVGLGITDAEGATLSMNEAALRLHGFESHHEMLARLPEYVERFELLEIDGTPLPLDRWPAMRVLRGESVTGQEFRLRNLDAGTERIVSYTVVPVRNTAGEPLLFLYLMDDITERKRSEAALREANTRLEEADRRKDEFIAVLSHELRNPLAPIRYALPLLRRDAHGEPAARAIAVIERQADQLTRLVDDLLDVARITRGSIELRREPVPLGRIVASAVEAASPLIAAAQHQLTTELPDEPVRVDADAARLAQVITNLLDNAAKYTPPGGRITLAAAREGDTAVVRVRDTGIGIAADALASVFDMFHQVDRRENAQGGLGIGLALVKRFVEMHGGTIEAHSGGPGLGAEFLLRLPIAPHVASEERGEPRSASGGQRLKVLIVDDNEDLVEMLAMVVTGLGHDVRTALDGERAIAAAVAYRPDVVLLDLGLPVVSGIEVGRELRRRPETRDARLIAITGWGQPEDRARTRDAGFDHHLTKPTDPDALEQLLAGLMVSGES